jgi:hypothetical protein
LTPSEWRRAQAKLRIERALQRLQAAQDHILRAADELAPLRYGDTARDHVMWLYDRVAAEARVVAELRHDNRVELDREPTPADLWEPPK